MNGELKCRNFESFNMREAVAGSHEQLSRAIPPALDKLQDARADASAEGSPPSTTEQQGPRPQLGIKILRKKTRNFLLITHVLNSQNGLVEPFPLSEN